jgi:hypothetical protein
MIFVLPAVLVMLVVTCKTRVFVGAVAIQMALLVHQLQHIFRMQVLGVVDVVSVQTPFSFVTNHQSRTTYLTLIYGFIFGIFIWNFLFMLFILYLLLVFICTRTCSTY